MHETRVSSVIEESDIQYLRDLLLFEGTLQILPFSLLRNIPQMHISQFCVEQGFYLIPTTELVEFIQKLISGRTAIEIGSGNGALGKALGIPCTDNFMQNEPKYKKALLAERQTPVHYGSHVLKLDAHSAIKKFKPEIVVASWVTHKFNPQKPEIEGNERGIDENFILRKVQKYIHIGNFATHKYKPIQDISHTTIIKPWIISRSLRREENIIQIWDHYVQTEL